MAISYQVYPRNSEERIAQDADSIANAYSLIEAVMSEKELREGEHGKTGSS